MITLDEVGALSSTGPSGNFGVSFGLYLPGIRAVDGFEVIARIIHRDDRFDPTVPPRDFPLRWVDGHPLDLWTAVVPIELVPGTHFGQDGTYLYRLTAVTPMRFSWWTRRVPSSDL